jgi:hypothetical protein
MRQESRIRSKVDRIRQHRERIERNRKRRKDEKDLIESWKWQRLRKLQEEGRLGLHATTADIKEYNEGTN